MPKAKTKNSKRDSNDNSLLRAEIEMLKSKIREQQKIINKYKTTGYDSITDRSEPDWWHVEALEAANWSGSAAIRKPEESKGGKKSCLRDMLNWPKDEFISFRREVRALALQYLDPSKSFRKQDINTLERLFRKAQEICPILYYYDAHWPTRDIVITYWAGRKRLSKARAKTRDEYEGRESSPARNAVDQEHDIESDDTQGTPRGRTQNRDNDGQRGGGGSVSKRKGAPSLSEDDLEEGWNEEQESDDEVIDLTRSPSPIPIMLTKNINLKYSAESAQNAQSAIKKNEPSN